MYVCVCVHIFFDIGPRYYPEKKLYIGSFFYLTNIACHFPHAIITQKLRFIRQASGYEVTKDTGQIKTSPFENDSIFRLCRINTEIHTSKSSFQPTISCVTTHTVKAACMPFNYLIFNFDWVPDNDPTRSQHFGPRCENIKSAVM
jgi:hypothetical protein